MRPRTNARCWPSALALLAVLALGAAGPQTRPADRSEPLIYTQIDYAVHQRLRFAQALLEARTHAAHGNAKKIAAAIEARDSAFTSYGWSMEKYQHIEQSVRRIISAIHDQEGGGEAAQQAKAVLADTDPATLATIRAHLRDLEQTHTDQARQQVEAEIRAQRRGPMPQASDLPGTWVFDADQTVELLAGDESPQTKQELRQRLQSAMNGASYTFGPGDACSVSSPQAGRTARTYHGTYRLAGSTLTITLPDEHRRQDLEIGLAEDQLHIGTRGVYSVFVKRH